MYCIVVLHFQRTTKLENLFFIINTNTNRASLAGERETDLSYLFIYFKLKKLEVVKVLRYWNYGCII